MNVFRISHFGFDWIEYTKSLIIIQLKKAKLLLFGLIFDKTNLW